MSCSLYNNGGFGCGGCIHFYRSLSITLTGDVLTITLPSETVRNREKFCICLAQNIPEGVTANTTVNIAVTGITDPFELLNRCGNRVYGDQLRTRKVLHAIALTDVPVFKLLDNSGICRTEHSFPTLVPGAAAPAGGTTDN